MARSRILDAVLGASYRLGGPRAWDLVRRGRVKILMYHGVPREARFPGVVNHYGYNVPLAEFEAHMEYLAGACHVVAFQDFVAGRDLSSARTNVVLTFDDGYGNNATQAFPVLERLGLPAIFALPTAFVLEDEPLWNDVVEYGVQRSERDAVRLEWDGEVLEYALDDAGRLALYQRLLRECVRVEQSRRNELVERALEALDVTADAGAMFENEDYRPLTRGEIGEMAASELVEFASHSVHHYLLAKLAPAAMRAELEESKRRIEELVGSPCTTFCVPGGSYDAAVVKKAFDVGFTHVLTSDVGPAVRGHRLLNRIGILREHTPDLFADVVHGPVLEVLGATRRAVGALRPGALL